MHLSNQYRNFCEEPILTEEMRAQFHRTPLHGHCNLSSWDSLNTLPGPPSASADAQKFDIQIPSTNPRFATPLLYYNV